MRHRPRVLVFGAGAVGCYVGGLLAGAGAEVTLLGRAPVGEEIAEHGLTLSDLHGSLVQLAADEVRFVTSVTTVGEVDAVLVTVKCTQTAEAARALAGVLRPGTLVVSLQNGVGNADALHVALPRCRVLAGMVAFNVTRPQPGRFHRSTDGGVAVQDAHALDDTGLAAMFDAVGLPLDRQADLRPVQWAKLLLNLNNAINALSGLPLRDQLAQRDYRRCLAAAQREGLRVLAAAGIRPARVTPLGPRAMAALLAAPDRLFAPAAPRVLAIDPQARSSMASDLERGRPTEIDFLCGEIVRLGVRTGVATPVNRRLTGLIHAAEAGSRRQWPAAELLAALRA
jgi:2-dehydropantoate 2-reductase